MNYQSYETKSSHPNTNTKPKRGGPPEQQPTHLNQQSVGKNGYTMYETRVAKNGQLRWYVVRNNANTCNNNNNNNNTNQPKSKSYKQQHQQSQQQQQNPDAMEIESIQVIDKT